MVEPLSHGAKLAMFVGRLKKIVILSPMPYPSVLTGSEATTLAICGNNIPYVPVRKGERANGPSMGFWWPTAPDVTGKLRSHAVGLIRIKKLPIRGASIDFIAHAGRGLQVWPSISS
jgi:hypothetical protein